MNAFHANSINDDIGQLYQELKDKPFYLNKKVNAYFTLWISFISINNLIIINSITNDKWINFNFKMFFIYMNIDLALLLYIETIFINLIFISNEDNISNNKYNSINSQTK